VASGDVLRSLKVRRSGELFSFGFSQGGHAALALHRLLQRRGVEVTATATVGGVFDPERFFLSGLANTTTLTMPLYVAYLLLAYDIYDVYDQLGDVFRRPYAATVADLLDMEHVFDDVVAGLPPTSRELLTACYLQAVTSNPDDELRVRLRSRGAEVTVRRLPGLDHVNSWVRAMPWAAGWFERLSAA
jgi:acetyl esterase/lipase